MLKLKETRNKPDLLTPKKNNEKGKKGTLYKSIDSICY